MNFIAQSLNSQALKGIVLASQIKSLSTPTVAFDRTPYSQYSVLHHRWQYFSIRFSKRASLSWIRFHFLYCSQFVNVKFFTYLKQYTQSSTKHCSGPLLFYPVLLEILYSQSSSTQSSMMFWVLLDVDFCNYVWCTSSVQNNTAK